MLDQPSPNASSESVPKPPSWILICFLTAAAMGFWFMHRADMAGLWLEDVPVYVHAVHAWMTGGNPYDDSLAPLFFLYPPAFLYLVGGLSHLFPAGWGEPAYIAFEVAAAVATPIVLARYFFRMSWLSPLLAVLLFFASPRYTGMLGLCTMNVASALYFLAFLGAIPGLRRNRWTWLYLAVFLASTIKITFLALLLLPLLAGKRQWLRSLVCGAAVVGVNLLENVLAPSLYAGYHWSLRQGILAQQQFGYGVFGVVATYHHKHRTGAGGAAYAAGGVLALVVVVLLFLLKRRLRHNSVEMTTNGYWLALVVASTILVNPREMQYDIDIALFAAFVLWVYALGTRRILALMVALFLPSLLVPLVVLNPHLYGIYETLVVLAGFGMGYRRLWNEAQSGVAERVIEPSFSGAA